VPKVSVIIPAFNASGWISEAVQSAVSQNIDDIEIVVIDDGSTDNTADIVEKNFPGIRVVKTENGGPSKARNLGTKLSNGDFIQYLDADDLLAPHKLATQLTALENSGLSVAYGDWQKLTRNSKSIFEVSAKVSRKLINPEIDLFTDFWAPPAAYLFRRSIVEKIGGWNENLPVIQDARFVLDCALYGARFIYCPGVMAYYRIHSQDTVSRRNAVEFISDCLNNARGVELWWLKHGGVNDLRKKALIEVYGHIARASFDKNKEIFEAALNKLENLTGGYIPQSPARLRIAAQLFGYRNAEKIASLYRNKLRSKIAK